MVLTVIAVIIGIIGVVGGARMTVYGDSLPMLERVFTIFTVTLSFTFLVFLSIVRIIQL